MRPVYTKITAGLFTPASSIATQVIPMQQRRQQHKLGGYGFIIGSFFASNSNRAQGDETGDGERREKKRLSSHPTDLPMFF